MVIQVTFLNCRCNLGLNKLKLKELSGVRGLGGKLGIRA